MRVDGHQLALLSIEAVRDGARRRVVPAVIVVCLLSLLMLESCTSCNAELQVSGTAAQAFEPLGWAGLAVFVVLALWSIALSGLLAADQLTSSLEDGTAQLVLARPVSRETFALARLLGSLVVSQTASLVLLGGATFLLVTRSGLDPGPAGPAILAMLLSGVTLAALAMTSSLYLPRMATFLAVLALTAYVGGVNLVGVAGGSLGGLHALVDQLGPPLASGIALPLAPWSGHEVPAGALLWHGLRGLVWCAGSVTLLLALFARRSIA